LAGSVCGGAERRKWYVKTGTPYDESERAALRVEHTNRKSVVIRTSVEKSCPVSTHTEK
jgi:hypothetical protein